MLLSPVIARWERFSRFPRDCSIFSTSHLKWNVALWLNSVQLAENTLWCNFNFVKAQEMFRQLDQIYLHWHCTFLSAFSKFSCPLFWCSLESRLWLWPHGYRAAPTCSVSLDHCTARIVLSHFHTRSTALMPAMRHLCSTHSSGWSMLFLDTLEATRGR